MTRWSESETKILVDKLLEGYTINEISKGNLLPGRSYDSIRKRFHRIKDVEWPPLWTAEEDFILKQVIQGKQISKSEIEKETGITRTMQQLEHRIEYLKNEMDS